jgi:pyridoxal phosphate enzyme (YggS family)
VVARFADSTAVTGGVGVRWHLLGHLQSNKARRAVTLFEAIQSVDSRDLAVRLDRLAAEAGRRLPIYFEVNVDLDPSKSGLPPDDLRRDLEALLELPALDPLGLMTVGSLAGDAEGARPTFRRLAALSVELSARDGRLATGLSMGMSDDFEVAIEEGSTCVRIGRAIFGERRPMP